MTIYKILESLFFSNLLGESARNPFLFSKRCVFLGLSQETLAPPKVQKYFLDEWNCSYFVFQKLCKIDSVVPWTTPLLGFITGSRLVRIPEIFEKICLCLAVVPDTYTRRYAKICKTFRIIIQCSVLLFDLSWKTIDIDGRSITSSNVARKWGVDRHTLRTSVNRKKGRPVIYRCDDCPYRGKKRAVDINQCLSKRSMRM